MKTLLAIIIIYLVSFSNMENIVENEVNPIEKNTFYYNLNVVNIDDNLEFHVELKYKSDSIHNVLLPFDYYGTPNLHQLVKSFQVKNGTTILNEESNSRRISPNKPGEVHLQYQIKYNVDELDKYSYIPNVSNTFFYMAGRQWMLPIYPLGKKATYNIQMINKDSDWILYSSLAQNTDNIIVESSYEDLLSAGFGGNSNPNSHLNFELMGTKYSVFVNGDFNFNIKELSYELKKILTAEKFFFKEKSFFKDKSKSYHHITILPRVGLVEGASTPNLFNCFVDTNQSARNIQEVIAHEYFHNWLPNKMYLPTLKDEFDFKHEWFHEGFTEYFSRKLMYNQNLIPKEYYVKLLNNDLISILNNPSANETYEEIASRDNFGSAQKKLSYYRGVLIALRWDHQLQEKGSNLRNMMLHLYSISKITNGKISYNDIYNYGSRYALNFEEDINRFIIQGESLRLEPGAIVAYTIKNKKINLFYIGFNAQKSAKEKVIQGVEQKGPAYKAGLRNGMEYVMRKNSNRWSNSWSEKLPYSVTVIDNGKEKVIEFFPYGDSITIQLYQRN